MSFDFVNALAEAGCARRSQSAGGYRVGGGELCSPEPERGRVREPFEGSRDNRAVALMVEQRSPKPRVVGSSPACPAAVHNPPAGLASPARGA